LDEIGDRTALFTSPAVIKTDFTIGRIGGNPESVRTLFAERARAMLFVIAGFFEIQAEFVEYNNNV